MTITVTDKNTYELDARLARALAKKAGHRAGLDRANNALLGVLIDIADHTPIDTGAFLRRHPELHSKLEQDEETVDWYNWERDY